MIERRRYRLSNDSIQVYRHSDKKIGWLREMYAGDNFRMNIYAPTHTWLKMIQLIFFRTKMRGLYSKSAVQDRV